MEVGVSLLAKERYLRNWHERFQSYVSGLISTIDSFVADTSATDNDKRILLLFREILIGRDVIEVENDLSNRHIHKSTLDKIEKIDKDMVDIATENTLTSPIVKIFIKTLFHQLVNSLKEETIEQLKVLQIPIEE